MKRPETYDFVIVGSGSAGGILTLRLSEDSDVKVLLLEAGPAASHWSIHIPGALRYNYMGGPRNWAFETEAEPWMNGRRLSQPRGKVVGGSSSLNGMVYVGGHALDYERWVEEGARGWSYPEVLPCFMELEHYRSGADAYRGDDGTIRVQRLEEMHPIEQAFLDAGVQAGYRLSADYSGAEQEGFTLFDANIEAGRRSATALACIRPAGRRSNVTIRTQAHVTRVLLEAGSAVGVEYVRAGRASRVQAVREVVLSAGAFGSPRLLMLSGVGPAWASPPASSVTAHDNRGDRPSITQRPGSHHGPC